MHRHIIQTHAYTCTDIHHTQIHTYIHTNVHTHAHTYIHISHTHTHHTHTYICIHAHTYHTHTYTYTHMHTYTHTCGFKCLQLESIHHTQRCINMHTHAHMEYNLLEILSNYFSQLGKEWPYIVIGKLLVSEVFGSCW